jgi:hypothetical protein
MAAQLPNQDVSSNEETHLGATQTQIFMSYDPDTPFGHVSYMHRACITGPKIWVLASFIIFSKR